jgi:hypothetical protein
MTYIHIQLRADPMFSLFAFGARVYSAITAIIKEVIRRFNGLGYFY